MEVLPLGMRGAKRRSCGVGGAGHTVEALAHLARHGARVEYRPGFLAPDAAEAWLRDLLGALEFDPEEASRVRLPFSRERVAIPRRQGAYGDAGTRYAFSGVVVSARPWIPPLLALRERLIEATGLRPNFVLVNHYRSGRDCIGWHADDERDLGPTPTILSLSLGATRDFQLRPRRAFGKAVDGSPELATVTLALESGSLLVLHHPTNRDWKHQLPRRANRPGAPVGERLNLTWREVFPAGAARR